MVLQSEENKGVELAGSGGNAGRGREWASRELIFRLWRVGQSVMEESKSPGANSAPSAPGYLRSLAKTKRDSSRSFGMTDGAAQGEALRGQR